MVGVSNFELLLNDSCGICIKDLNFRLTTTNSALFPGNTVNACIHVYNIMSTSNIGMCAIALVTSHLSRGPQRSKSYIHKIPLEQD